MTRSHTADVPFAKTFPLDVIRRLALVLYEKGDLKTLRSLQRVSHDYWEITTPIIWRRLVLQQPYQPDSFLNIHHLIVQKSPTTSEWEWEITIDEMYRQLENHSEDDALISGLRRFVIGCQAVRRIVANRTVVSTHETGLDIGVALRCYGRRMGPSPLFPNLVHIDLPQNIPGYRGEDCLKAILDLGTPALRSMCSKGRPLRESSMMTFPEISSVTMICFHQHSVHQAIYNSIPGVKNIIHLPRGQSHVSVTAPSFLMYGRASGSCEPKIPSTTWEIRGASLRRPDQETERKAVATALTYVLTIVRHYAKDSPGAVGSLIQRLEKSGAWTYVPKGMMGMIEERCSVCGGEFFGSRCRTMLMSDIC